ncbi:MAG: hypothetical protein ACMXYG_04640 [Candidatus Woesearchaeota archaeon]
MNRRQLNHYGKCPRCGKLKVGEDYFCEHCCYNWLDGKFIEPNRSHTTEL